MAHVSRANDHLIVMTACVDPSTGPARIARSDPRVRLNDYLEAMRFWFRLGDPRLRNLLLIENSGYSFDAFHRLIDAEKPSDMRVELVQTNSNNYAPGLHYGYSELLMLDLGLAMSDLAKGCRYWMKVTGRLRFPMIGRLLDRLPREYLFAADLRNAIPVFGDAQHWVHTRLMITEGRFYGRELRGLCRRMKPNNEPIEQVLYDVLYAHKGEPGAIVRFPVHVPPHGQSAYEDFSYQNTKRTMVDLARHAARFVFPDWWI